MTSFPAGLYCHLKRSERTSFVVLFFSVCVGFAETLRNIIVSARNDQIFGIIVYDRLSYSDMLWNPIEITKETLDVKTDIEVMNTGSNK